MTSSNGSRLKFKARVVVMPKPTLADPQGSTVQSSTATLGWSNVSDVRVGKNLEFVVESTSEEEAKAQVIEMCQRLLANLVIESYSVSVERL